MRKALSSRWEEFCKQIIIIVQCDSCYKRGGNKVYLPRRGSDQIQLRMEDERFAKEETLEQVWTQELK